MIDTDADPAEVVERLLRSVNAHQIDDLVRCFAEDYLNETPAHPQRGFRGRDQVRRNWTGIFARVPDVQARVRSTAGRGDTLWTEWEMSGTRTDSGGFLMRGVVIFRASEGVISSARFYLEPVEELTGNADAAIGRVLGSPESSGEETS